jgi:hypothetical protein
VDAPTLAAMERLKQFHVSQAFVTYATYMNELSALANDVPQLYDTVNVAANKFSLTPLDSESHKPAFHALLIIGAWGALEACISDIFRGVFQDEPQRLTHEKFQSLNVSFSDLLTGDDAKPYILYRAIEKKVNESPKGRDPIKRFEGILEYADLSGKIGPEIIKKILLAYRIRNVWAHCAGRVDDQFLLYASHLGFKRGEIVAISNEDARRYMLCLLVYSQIIVNRWLIKKGFKPTTLTPTPLLDGPLREEFESLYAQHGP